jgi:hypothetical protein
MRPSVDFSWSPIGVALGYTFGTDSYPYIHQQDNAIRASDVRYASYATPINTAITFTANVVAPTGLIIYEYRWNFGDGTIGYGPTVTHEYKAAAPETQASLQVKDSRNQITTRFQTLNLRPAARVTINQVIRVTP